MSLEATKKDNKLITTETRVEGDNVLLAHELSKYYKSKPIIKNVSFSVKSGECFGLLGVNEMGKSSIFKILTGEESPNKGDIFLKGYDLFTERREVNRKIF